MPRPQKHIHQELKKELLVVETYTIVNPGAVMIHPGDTSAACGAVMRQW